MLLDMVVTGHRIERKVEIDEFLELMKNYSKEKIECTKHTFFRLSEKQRKIFKDEDILRYILEQKPIFVGTQYNGAYAVFYDYKEKDVIRIVLDIKPNKIEVVTFYIIDKKQVPIIK